MSLSLICHLKNNHFRGNIRQLMKIIERGIINCVRPVMGSKDITDFGVGKEIYPDALPKDDLPPATKITDDEIIFWMEKLDHNKSKVAKRLGVTYRTILRRWKNIVQPSFNVKATA